jgi:hypothetical protein
MVPSASEGRATIFHPLRWRSVAPPFAIHQCSQPNSCCNKRRLRKIQADLSLSDRYTHIWETISPDQPHFETTQSLTSPRPGSPSSSLENQTNPRTVLFSIKPATIEVIAACRQARQPPETTNYEMCYIRNEPKKSFVFSKSFIKRRDSLQKKPAASTAPPRAQAEQPVNQSEIRPFPFLHKHGTMPVKGRISRVGESPLFCWI